MCFVCEMWFAIYEWSITIAFEDLWKWKATSKDLPLPIRQAGDTAGEAVPVLMILMRLFCWSWISTVSDKGKWAMGISYE